MLTLISVFDKRSAARRAMQRLMGAGFERSDIHLREPDEPAAVPDADSREQELELRGHVMKSAGREVAVNRGMLESIDLRHAVPCQRRGRRIL